MILSDCCASCPHFLGGGAEGECFWKGLEGCFLYPDAENDDGGSIEGDEEEKGEA